MKRAADSPDIKTKKKLSRTEDDGLPPRGEPSQVCGPQTNFYKFVAETNSTNQGEKFQFFTGESHIVKKVPSEGEEMEIDESIGFYRSNGHVTLHVKPKAVGTEEIKCTHFVCVNGQMEICKEVTVHPDVLF